MCKTGLATGPEPSPPIRFYVIFQIGGEAKLDTQCHHGSDGPPLKSYLFDVHDEALRFAMYAERTVLALGDTLAAFPGLRLHGRLAILVPDAKFRNIFNVGLKWGSIFVAVPCHCSI